MSNSDYIRRGEPFDEIARDAAMSEWRDIASAPKDGTAVLLLSPKWRNPSVGWWLETFGGWHSFPGSYGMKPTHWMPLPLPPTRS